MLVLLGWQVGRIVVAPCTAEEAIRGRVFDHFDVDIGTAGQDSIAKPLRSGVLSVSIAKDEIRLAQVTRIDG